MNNSSDYQNMVQGDTQIGFLNHIMDTNNWFNLEIFRNLFDNVVLYCVLLVF